MRLDEDKISRGDEVTLTVGDETTTLEVANVTKTANTVRVDFHDTKFKVVKVAGKVFMLNEDGERFVTDE